MGSGFSRKAAAGLLEYLLGKAETKVSKPAEVFLALCTAEVKESTLSAGLSEATYTTYARKAIKPADLSEATEAQPSIIETVNELIFAKVDSGSSTIISWAICTSGTTGGGAILAFGQCTSTALSTTQTPPTVAAKALKVELKAT